MANDELRGTKLYGWSLFMLGRAVHNESLRQILLVRTFCGAGIDEIRRGCGQTKNRTSPAAHMLPDIQQFHQEGLSLSEIGRRFGLTHQAIGRLLNLANRKNATE
jgi:hypothetical protein